jgi:stage II sporulation protein GA (sporulation sigma-E factor processing peptidase)
MIVYVDVVLLENIAMNYIILIATAIIGKYKINYFRCIASSFIGSIYAVANYAINFNLIQNLIAKILISLLMVVIAFKGEKIKAILKQLMLFYLVSFTFGGAAFMLLFFLRPEEIIYENGHLIGTYPLKIALLGGVVGFTVISITSNIIRDRRKIKSMLCDIEIFYNSKSVRLKTMIDSGNLLKDPISNNDVIIVEKNSLRGILDDDLLNHIDDILNGKWLDDNNIHNYKFKLIPFSSLGNENGIILGFKPEYIKIYDEEEKLRKEVIVGIYPGKLTKTNLYTSLIGLNILKEGIQYENFFRKA